TAEGNLRTIDPAGGAATDLVRGVNLSPGGTFGPGRTVIFGALGEGLRFKHPGEPAIRPLTHVDRAHGERDHLWPRWVPALDAVLFTVAYDAPGQDRIAIASLEPG